MKQHSAQNDRTFFLRRRTDANQEVRRIRIPGLTIALGFVVCIVVMVSLASATASADILNFNVKTKVDGTADTVIGTIKAEFTGPPTQADFYQKGTFTFDNDWTRLEDCYDFRWVQIITDAPDAIRNADSTKFKDKDGNYTQTPGEPWVDPPSGGYKYQEADGGADNDPFYENSGNGNYHYPNYSDRHTEYVDSWTDDMPGPSGVDFETYLVAIGDGIAAKSFVTLAGYSWSTDVDGDGDLVSDKPVQIGIDNAAIGRINTAMANSGFKEEDYNNKWTAVRDHNFSACPEPSPLVVIGMGAFLAFAFCSPSKRRRRLQNVD